jgi:hypothetical protein
MTWRLAAVALVCATWMPGLCEEEFTFEYTEAEPEPFSLGGYVELRPSLALLDANNALFALNYPEGVGPETQTQYLLRAQLESTYDWDDVHLKLRTNTDLVGVGGEWDATSAVHEAYAGWQADPHLALDVGKKQVKWGTGYSWSPVAFLDRPKDPDEPDLPRAGFTMVSAEYVKTFPGSLQNVAVTLAVIPRTGGLNGDFGDRESTNYAGRLHLLWHDTDIDMMALSGGSQPVRYGVDFARNLRTNFEIHGEWSHTPSEERTTVGSDGTIRTGVETGDRLLLGLRYLTPSDVTYIAEYQYNSVGLSHSELRDFYGFVSDAAERFATTGDATDLDRARQLNRRLTSARPVGRNALYLRASVKEPRNILYLTPAVTLQMNLDDGSFSLAPEAVYTGYENWELRARAFLLSGDRDSEFGGRQNEARFELMARRYF